MEFSYQLSGLNLHIWDTHLNCFTTLKLYLWYTTNELKTEQLYVQILKQELSDHM